MLGPGWKAAVEATLRISPPPYARMLSSTANARLVSERTLRSIISSWPSSGSESKRPRRPKPALLMSVRTHSPRDAISASSFSVALGLLRSAAMTCALPISAASLLRRSLRRATRMTSSPRAAHCFANSTPRPAEAPVISVAGLGVIESARGPDFGLHDLAGVRRRLALRKRVDIVHAALDLAPDGILVVEETGVVEADE